MGSCVWGSVLSCGVSLESFFFFSSFTIGRVRIFTADWPHGGLGGQVPTSAQLFVWCWRAIECCDRLQCFSVSISDPGPSLSMCQSLRLSCCFRPFSLFSGVSREPFTAVASAGRQEMDCLWPLSLSLLYPDYPTSLMCPHLGVSICGSLRCVYVLSWDFLC